MSEKEKSYEQFLKDAQKLADEYEKRSGQKPLEVYNRFALLYLDRIILEKNNYKHDSKLTYRECKLMVGVSLTAHVHERQDHDKSPHLYYLQQYARRNGWILRHYDSVEIPLAKCIKTIVAAFNSTINMNPRVPDIRMCLQLGSPTLWGDAAAGDFMVEHTEEGMFKEVCKMFAIAKVDPPKSKEDTDEQIEQLMLDPPGTIMISPLVFAQETQRYIEEHMKFELDSGQRVAFIKNFREFLDEA